MEEDTQEQKKEVSQEDSAKIQWVVQLFGFIKTLQREIEKKERSKRYFSIFVSGCLTYFIVKILHQLLQTESDFVVFFGAFVCLCLHYTVDNVSRTWNQAISLKKFHASLMKLEKERLDLGISEDDISFDDDTKKDER
tara:strand:+ start:110 stop:523 length:414 start_codon:yes stop_codon:yes gene_type:complete